MPLPAVGFLLGSGVTIGAAKYLELSSGDDAPRADDERPPEKPPRVAGIEFGFWRLAVAVVVLGGVVYAVGKSGIMK